MLTRSYQEPSAIRLWDGSGPEADNGRVKQWSSFSGNPTSIHDTWSVLPLGLYLKTDVTGRDPSKWSVDAWLYDNVLYKSTDDFRAAVMQPEFKSLGANIEGLWAELEKEGDTPQFDESPPPAQVMSGSKRFSVDTEAQYVSWSKSGIFQLGKALSGLTDRETSQWTLASMSESASAPVSSFSMSSTKGKEFCMR